MRIVNNDNKNNNKSEKKKNNYLFITKGISNKKEDKLDKKISYIINYSFHEFNFFLKIFFYYFDYY